MNAALFDPGHLHDCAGVVLHRCKGFFAGDGVGDGSFMVTAGLSGQMMGVSVRGAGLGVLWVNLGVVVRCSDFP